CPARPRRGSPLPARPADRAVVHPPRPRAPVPPRLSAGPPAHRPRSPRPPPPRLRALAGRAIPRISRKSGVPLGDSSVPGRAEGGTHLSPIWRRSMFSFATTTSGARRAPLGGLVTGFIAAAVLAVLAAPAPAQAGSALTTAQLRAIMPHVPK